MMLLNEKKLLFDKIKQFRGYLTEGVSDSDIEKYINNREYIYIYYGGDSKNRKGYRTIRPYVLGVSNANNKVIRAWQDKGRSFSFDNKPTRTDSHEHDYWGEGGKSKPGWRLFRLDKIERIYPIGKNFVDNNNNVLVPPKYNEGGDKDMKSIIAFVSTKDKPPIDREEPVTKLEPEETKWDRFENADKERRKIIDSDVIKLRDIASRVYKKRHSDFLVAINNKNEYELVNIRNKDKIPEKAVVGSLPYLYAEYVKKEPTDNKFYEKKRDEFLKNLNEIKESNTIPHKFTTFFKL